VFNVGREEGGRGVGNIIQVDGWEGGWGSVF